MEAKLRKYRNNLITGGFAIILLSLWDAAKLVISLFLDTTYKESLSELFDMDDTFLFVLEVLVFVIFYGIVIFFNIFTGLTAIAVGKGKKRKPVYLVIGIIVFFIDIYSVYSSITDMVGMTFDINIAGIILDLTSAVATADLFISSIMVYRLSRKTGQGG